MEPYGYEDWADWLYYILYALVDAFTPMLMFGLLLLYPVRPPAYMYISMLIWFGFQVRNARREMNNTEFLKRLRVIEANRKAGVK